MSSYNFVETGFDSPSISLTSENQVIFRYGEHFKPEVDELPFDTTGEWDIDKGKFSPVTDFSGMDAPVVYMSAKIISDTAAAEMPEGTVEVKTDFVPTDDEIEVQWGYGEISRARDMIECHVNGCPSATENVADWRTYWVDLRAHIAAPVGLLANRPPAPDA